MNPEQEVRADIILKVLRSISHLKGKEKCRFASYFRTHYGYPETEVRVLVHALRSRGEPIGSSPTDGYFYCTTPEELEATIEWFNAKIKDHYDTVSKLKGCMTRLSQKETLF